MNQRFNAFAKACSDAAGSVWAFIGAVLLIVAWLVVGPMFKWSEGHSLAINTATTCITFLMVFVIQSSQNRDSKATQAKLDALLESGKASNRFIGLEAATDEELQQACEWLKERREMK